MTSHTLAKKLLEHPDLPVCECWAGYGTREIDGFTIAEGPFASTEALNVAAEWLETAQEGETRQWPKETPGPHIELV